MKKKYWFLISFIWFVFVCFFAVYGSWPNFRKQEFTWENKSCVAGEFAYVTETVGDCGYLYRLDQDGRVSAMTNTGKVERNAVYSAVACENTVSDERGGVYAVERSNRLLDGEWRQVYRILRYDRELSFLGQSDAFFFEEAGELTGFSVSDEAFYLTSVSKTGENAYVYLLDRQFYEPQLELALDEREGEEQEVVLRLSCSLLRESESGRFISQARYQDGLLYAALDDGTDIDFFTPPDAARTGYEKRIWSFPQMLAVSRGVLIQSAVLFLAGIVILFLAAITLRNKNRIVYMMFTLEGLILFLTVAGGWCVIESRKSAQREAQADFSFHYLEALLNEADGLDTLADTDDLWYDSEQYQNLQKNISRCMQAGSVGNFFSDICVVRTSDGVIVASGSGKNQIPVNLLYTSGAKALAETLANGVLKAQTTVQISHITYPVFGVAGTKSISHRYVLVGIGCPESAVYYWDIVFAGIVCFCLVSIICTLYMIWQINDLRKLESAMQSMISGGKELQHTRVYGNDMQHIWGSLFETDKTIKNMNYARYKIFEAYCRFAPSNIEKILQKDYITEVVPGDSREVSGSMAVICLDEEKSVGTEEMERLSKVVALIEGCRKRQDGVLVSMDSGLSAIQILFMENAGEPVEFGLDLLHDLGMEGIGASVLLYTSKFLYGVVGTNDQCFSFIRSQEKEQIEQCSIWLKQQGLGLVVTEDVLEKRRIGSATRCLGFITLNGKESPVKLYEVLDTCPDEERRGKLKYLESFNQALELFYQKDFYLARSKFTEILRAMPEDGIVRWYIFTCEKYLNETNGENITFSLNQGGQNAE